MKNNLNEAAINLVHKQTVFAQTCSIKAKMLKRDSKNVSDYWSKQTNVELSIDRYVC